MDTKTITVRIPGDVFFYLTRNGEKLNPELINSVRRLKRIREVAMAELKGVFNSNEWAFIFDMLNGITIDENFSSSPSVFIAECMDSEKYDNKATAHNVDLDNMIEKIKRLHGANIDAIYDRAKLFFSDSNNKLNDFVNY